MESSEAQALEDEAKITAMTTSESLGSSSSSSAAATGAGEEPAGTAGGGERGEGFALSESELETDAETELAEADSEVAGRNPEKKGGDEGLLEGVALREEDAVEDSDDEEDDGVVIYCDRNMGRKLQAGRGTYESRQAAMTYVRPQPLPREVLAAKAAAEAAAPEGGSEATDAAESKPTATDELKRLRFSHHRTAFDVDIDALDAHPWREYNVDISDYFNYGFTEASWRQYCEKQLKIRAETGEGPPHLIYYQRQQQALKDAGGDGFSVPALPTSAPVLVPATFQINSQRHDADPMIAQPPPPPPVPPAADAQKALLLQQQQQQQQAMLAMGMGAMGGMGGMGWDPTMAAQYNQFAMYQQQQMQGQAGMPTPAPGGGEAAAGGGWGGGGGGEGPPHVKICYSFQNHGSCERGAACRFSHDAAAGGGGRGGGGRGGRGFGGRGGGRFDDGRDAPRRDRSRSRDRDDRGGDRGGGDRGRDRGYDSRRY